MHRISLIRLRLVLKHELWRTTAVTASHLGGWLVQRPARSH
jgi:hypothetical protein